jgi:hypothetical protein
MRRALACPHTQPGTPPVGSCRYPTVRLHYLHCWWRWGGQGYALINVAYFAALLIMLVMCLNDCNRLLACLRVRPTRETRPREASREVDARTRQYHSAG